MSKKRSLYLVLVCLFALAMPVLNYIENIQEETMHTSYLIPWFLFYSPLLFLPLCSILFGWSIVRFFDIRKINNKAFWAVRIILLLYALFILPACLFPIIGPFLNMPLYMNTIIILIDQINFLLAYFVVLGMGLAYYEKTC